MERVESAEVRAALEFARNLLLRAELAERTFFGKKIEYRDRVVAIDWFRSLQVQNAMRIAFSGGVCPTYADWQA